MPKVNRKHLFEFTFSLPTIKTQISIIKELESLRVDSQNLDKEYRKKLVNLEELKKSILQKAFSGELTQKEAVV
jgi:type I restriction enzyme S subunit